MTRDSNPQASDIVVARLARFGPLSDRDMDLVRSVPLAAREMESEQELAREGDKPAFCPLLVEGFACRHKILGDGQRQIIAFHLPSDLCDVSGLTSTRLDHGTLTLTPARVIMIPYGAILDWMRRSPGLNWLLWRAVLVDTAVANEWIVNVGRRTAQRRTAHLFCEMIERLRRVGQAGDGPYVLPLTQVVLADALGLTPVHVSRTLQWLRGERLIEFSGGVLTVRDWRELKRTARFDPAYLH